jgi:signal transduction histidine kinase
MVVTALVAPVLGTPVVALGPAALVGVYTVGARTPPPRSAILLCIAVTGMAIAVVASGMDVDTVVSNALAFAVAWWLGDRSRRALAATDAERAAAADIAARAVADERLRIARELHDVVAHAMSLIAVQAGSGRLVIDESPEVARASLSTIETTSREALQEMRRLLAVLRDDSMPSVLAPSPGVGDLDELVARTVENGMRVNVRTDGVPAELPAGVGLCVYRVVQEALTNVRKHARATSVDVDLRYEPNALKVEVLDDGIGSGAVSGGGGHGLLGLRERVELYGGSFEAGPVARGFRVVARFPLGALA